MFIVDKHFFYTEIHFEKEQFENLVVFLPIFVADTKVIYGYDFVAPLRTWKKKLLTLKKN